MHDFQVPQTQTKIKGEVTLEYAFRLQATYDPPTLSPTTRNGRFYQNITGGEVKGERLNATVYPDRGGEYDTMQSGDVRDINAHFMLRTDNGEWIYVEHAGIRRPDGYYRVIAYIEADTKGAHDWLNNTTFVVTAQESSDLCNVTFTYYVAN